MLDHIRIGIVDDLRARTAAIVAANPRHAARILGERSAKPATITAPILLARPMKKAGKKGPPEKYPWRGVAIGEWFDVPASETTSRTMSKNAANARIRLGRWFRVRQAIDSAGHSVIRATRIG